jgi:hypothetical protein
VQRRRGRLGHLTRLAQGARPGDADVDDQGRTILRTGKQVQEWMRFWSSVKRI